MMQLALELPFAPKQIHSITSCKAALISEDFKVTQSERIMEILEDEGERGATGREISNETGIKEHTISARLRGLEMIGKIIKTSQERQEDDQITQSHVYVLPKFFKQYMGIAEQRIPVKVEDYRRACSIINAVVNGNKETAYKAAEQFLNDIRYSERKW